METEQKTIYSDSLRQEPELIIFTGNIGTGKSLIARKFSKNGAVVINRDSIQRMCAGGEYAFDVAKVPVYNAIENAGIETALSKGLSVVVDRTNMDKKRRAKFIEIGKRYTCKIICYDFGPDNERKGVLRRKKDPYGMSAREWDMVHESMKKSYEEPEIAEGFSEIRKPPERYTFHAFDFDGILVENKFPHIGRIIPEYENKIRALWEDFSNIVIIWTCRTGDSENRMRSFLLKRKIPFDFINENPVFDPGSRKIFAHYYYDDRNSY